VKLDIIRDEVIVAYDRINGLIHHTSLIKSHTLSELISGQVFLKCENEQVTGSFKARGSLNKILSINEKERSQGMITASTGNHALGFSRALSLTNTKGTVFLPNKASEAKVKALSHFPVDLERYGNDSLSTELYAKENAKSTNSIWMSPYNDLQVIAGQGTIGVEILQEIENVDAVLATVGGGGLISGVGGYMKSVLPNIEVIGCQPENSPEMTLSLEAGEIVDLPEFIETLSDGSAGGIEPNAITFSICQEIIDKSILVSENEIKEGIRHIFHFHKKVIEGAAGVAVASLQKNIDHFKGKTVVIILCGSNIESKKFVDIVNEN